MATDGIMTAGATKSSQPEPAPIPTVAEAAERQLREACRRADSNVAQLLRELDHAKKTVAEIERELEYARAFQSGADFALKAVLGDV